MACDQKDSQMQKKVGQQKTNCWIKKLYVSKLKILIFKFHMSSLFASSSYHKYS